MVQRRGKGPGDGALGQASLVEARVVVQAVLLADSFAETFRPITMDRPKVLLPLAGIPMIDYTLEWLAAEGVEECFVLCCAHAQKVQEHLSSAGWLSQKHFTVTTVVARDCISTGDALRHIDQKGLVQGDFVLVSGDVVANLPLAPALAQHRERRKSDKQAVLTMLMRASSVSPVTEMTPLGSGRQVVAVDPASGQLLAYEPPLHIEDALSEGARAGTARGRGALALDGALLEEHAAVVLHTDWEDCHVDICGPEVLHLYTDNFDYQHPRRDFVKGILSDDIMGNKIFVHEVPDSVYAARVESLRAYARVTHDILGRWTFPFAPDAAAACTSAQAVVLGDALRYMGLGVRVARSCAVGPATLLGGGTSLGECTRVAHSVLGRNCAVGRDVQLHGALVWDNVSIGDGAIVRHAVICDGASIGAGSIVEEGAVVGFNVTVDPGSVVVALARLSGHPQPEDEGSDDEHLEYSGAGDDSEEDEQEPGHPAVKSGGGQVHRWKVRGASCPLAVWRQSCAPVTRAVLEELGQLRLKRDSDLAAAAASSAAVAGGEGGAGDEKAENEEEEEDEGEEDEDDEFTAEVEEFFKRAAAVVSHDNVVLEVNTLKLAFNKTFADCASAMLKAVLKHSLARLQQPAGKPLLAAAKEGIAKWAPLLRRFLKNSDDEVELLLTLEEVCEEEHKGLAPFFQHVLQVLYDTDCVSEDAVLAWAEEKKDADEEDKVFLNQSQQFITWLKEADEEEDDDDEE